MKILVTADPEIPVPPIHYGGVQRLVDTLIIKLKEKGHTIALVAHRESTSPVDKFFPFPGVESHNKIDILRNTLTLRKAVQKFKPDVIHSFSRLMYLLPFLSLPIPKIISYGRNPTSFPVHWGAKLAGNSLVFAGCSEYISRIGQSAGGNWHTVYNFVDIEKFTFQPTVAPDAPLVFLSRVEPIKGAHTAIAAAKRTGRRLIIAGNYSDNGEEGRYWREEIVPHLGRDGIEYFGSVNDAQKNELLGQAAAMIVPIEWEEPFGIVFAEALICGTPVISCPRGALPEIIRHGVDGYLVNNLSEAVAAVEQLANINRHNCRQRVEQCFSASAIVEQYEKLYQSLLSK